MTGNANETFRILDVLERKARTLMDEPRRTVSSSW